MTRIRPFNTLLFLIIAFLFVSQPLMASKSVAPNNDKLYLTATKGDKKKYYRVSKYITLFVNEERIKGKIVNISTDSISIKNRKNDIKTVAISDIDAIQNNNRSVRVGWMPILGILILLTIGGLLTTGLVAGLFLIMPVLALYTAIPIWLISLLAEPLSKKSAKKGWVFKAETK